MTVSSKVAFAITGTRWNGPRFFGLRDKEDRSAMEARSCEIIVKAALLSVTHLSACCGPSQQAFSFSGLR